MAVRFSLLILLAPALAWADQANGKHGAVATASADATEAAIEVLRRGGSAADAAMCAALVLAVTEPQSSGLGGGGFALIYDAKHKDTKVLDFRERAPVLAAAKLYTRDGQLQPELTQTGALAVAVPGEVAGLFALQKKYGKRPVGELFDDAIRLASKGVIVSSRLGNAFEARSAALAKYDTTKIAWQKNGKWPETGDKFLQPDLAKSLKLLQQKGAAAFYKGDIAKKIATTVTNYGGVLAQVDLSDYDVKWSDPVAFKYRGYDLYSLPPPSSGGVNLGELLGIMESLDVAKLGYHSPRVLHYAIEAMRRVYADRTAYLGDPAFISVPVQGLLSKEYTHGLFAAIDPKKATPSEQVRAGRPEGASEPTHTTHLSVIDEAGNVVLITTTVNGSLGSAVVADGTGILLNNEMDDFAVAPGVPNQFGVTGGDANSLAPKKTPLSSIAPTLIFKDGQFRYGLGTPGGSTIITQIFWMVLDLIDYQSDLAAAVAAPRIHEQWQPDRVMVEKLGFDASTIAALQAMGQQIETRDAWGNAQIVGVLANGKRAAATDPRGEGAARAY